jgi:hypothetical protein
MTIVQITSIESRVPGAGKREREMRGRPSKAMLIDKAEKEPPVLDHNVYRIILATVRTIERYPIPRLAPTALRLERRVGRNPPSSWVRPRPSFERRDDRGNRPFRASSRRRRSAP